MIIKYKIYFAIYVVITIILLSSCSLSPDVEGIIEKSGKSIATVQIANAGKALADTRKIKAETTQKYGTDVMILIGAQPLDLQADLISQTIEARVDVSNNTRYKGFIEGLSVVLVLFGIALIVKYFFPQPTEEIKKY